MPLLQYTLPQPTEMRTCHVLEDQGDGDMLQLFKFQTFSHNRTCETDFQRYNKETNRYETAGIIQWSGNKDARVVFGIVEFKLKDLRALKKATSESRRFRWKGSEYRWKRGGTDGKDLVLYDWLKRVLASYKDESMDLTVSDRGYAILDQVVVTCLLNRWMLSLGSW